MSSLIRCWVLISIFSLNLNSQTDLGSWNVLNMRYKLNSSFSLFGEAQLRSLKFYDHFHYYEMKGGVNYNFKELMVLSIGGGRFDTYREGGNFVTPKNQNEIRTWFQAQFTDEVKILKFEHRYRSEFRFTDKGFRMRFRYRLAVETEAFKKLLNEKPIKFQVGNELFFTNTAPYFERNRLSFQMSRKLNQNIETVIGFINQFDYKINDETGRQFLMIGVNLTLN